MTLPSFPEFVGPACALLAYETNLTRLEQSYREPLEQNGVTFLSPELEETKRLFTAVALGEIVLEEDGSPVSFDNFDQDAASELLTANRAAVINSERLASLRYLGLLSKGASLMRRKSIQQYGPSTPSEFIREVNTSFKQFVQISIATEEWGQPWVDVVAENFEGEALTFPLNADGVARGLTQLNLRTFKELRLQHFQKLGLHEDNLRQALEGLEAGVLATPLQLQVATRIALFYRHSPQGCTGSLQRALDKGVLPADIDWQSAIEGAVEQAGRLFDNE